MNEQKLHPADFAPRGSFCAWFLHQCVDNSEFPHRILFTDEALFTREAVLNCRNSHIWDDANHHAIQTIAFQERLGTNVRAGIIDGHLIGTHVLPYRLTGLRCLIFLQEILLELLADFPLAVRPWLQFDGAPAHFSRAVREHLDQTW